MAMKTWQDLRPLFPYLRPYRQRYLLGLGSLLAEVFFWVAVPQIIRFAIDDLTQGVSSDKLIQYAALLFVAALCKGFFLYWTRMIIIGISRDAEYALRNDLYRHLTRLSLSFFQRNRVGDIMSRSTNDLNAVRMLLGPGIMYSGRTLVIMAGAIAIMAHISPKLTLYTFTLAPVIAGIVVYFGKRIHHRFEAIQAMMSDISARVQESLAGIRVLRAYAQEESDLAQFQTLNRDFMERNRKLIRVWGMFYPILEVLMGLVTVTVLWAGGREVARGAITIGDFVAFNVYMAQLAWPMVALGWVVNLHQRGLASLKRLDTILSEAPEIADDPMAHLISMPAPKDGVSEQTKGASIEFRSLSFSYNGVPATSAAALSEQSGKGTQSRKDRRVLQEINLLIPAGSTVAIVGPTGCGKSTLVNLIPRLFEVPTGTILIDGVEIHQYRLADLRRMIGFVPQETFLFSETVRENIAFGVEQSSEEEVRQAAEVAGLLSDIDGFPRGFETMVGERGITLSGGQKQRAAIARAVVRDPRIVILDDALSSVDTYTEELILMRLQRVLRGRTAVIISHRTSTVKHADLIVVLVDGAIVERGTHAELMQSGTYYPELYQKQLLEEELEKA